MTTSPRAVTPLTAEEVEMIYAAYDQVAGWEAKSIEGKRRIAEPLYKAVIEARVATAQRQSGSGDMAVALDDYYRARHTKDPAQVRRANSAIKSATLETLRRYNAGEITERQACDWFRVDRLTFRTALATLDAARSTPDPAGAGLREALDQAVWGFKGEPRRCSRCNTDEGDEHSPTCPMPALLATVQTDG